MPVLRRVLNDPDRMKVSSIAVGHKSATARWERAKKNMNKAVDAYTAASTEYQKAKEALLNEIYGAPHGTKITNREKEILDLVRARKANKEIGLLLCISERSVKFHVTNLLRKFGAQERTNL